MTINRLTNPRTARGATVVSSSGSYSYDADAAAYIRAVEVADGQQLEQSVRNAITQFVLGLKADGAWTPIKFACILMGARTLSGALTPLVGSAPTNSNFVSGDYARGGAFPGLTGNASTKQLNSNRANNADGQNDCHAFAFVTRPPISNSVAVAFGSGWFSGTDRYLVWVPGSGVAYASASNAVQNANSGALSVGGWGVSRNGASSWASRAGISTVSRTESSVTPASGNVYFFSVGGNFYSSLRLSFVSLGTYLDLDVLNARVATLQAAISGAIP